MVMLNVVVLNVVMESVIMLSVDMLNVVAPTSVYKKKIGLTKCFNVDA